MFLKLEKTELESFETIYRLGIVNKNKDLWRECAPQKELREGQICGPPRLTTQEALCHTDNECFREGNLKVYCNVRMFYI